MRLVPVFGGPATPVILWWIVGTMIAIEAISQLADQGLIGGLDLRYMLQSNAAFYAPLFPPGQVDSALYPGQAYLMLISYAFLHAGTIHVLMNTVILIALAKTLAVRFGVGFVLSSMGLGAISSSIFFGYLSDTSAYMIGSSGVVFSLIGLWLYMGRIDAPMLGTPTRSIISILIGLVVVHVLLHIFMGGQIAWQAHLGGFVMGYFVMPWFVRLGMWKV